MNHHIHKNPDFIHHQDMPNQASLRQAVFGMEDGMVSTLGSITGIAAATGDPFTTILAGCVIIGVESISMGVGSYLSSKSDREIDERKLLEERIEIKKYPKEEEEELVEMYVKDGWSEPLAKQMAAEAAQNKDLFLQEMAYRELKVFPDALESPKSNGVVMGISYIAGGIIPVLPYFLLPLSNAFSVSIIITLAGLFSLGAYTTKFSKRSWVRAGFEMLVLAGLAAGIGYAVGQIVNMLGV